MNQLFWLDPDLDAIKTKMMYNNLKSIINEYYLDWNLLNEQKKLNGGVWGKWDGKKSINQTKNAILEMRERSTLRSKITKSWHIDITTWSTETLGSYTKRASFIQIPLDSSERSFFRCPIRLNGSKRVFIGGISGIDNKVFLDHSRPKNSVYVMIELIECVQA